MHPDLDLIWFKNMVEGKTVEKVMVALVGIMIQTDMSDENWHWWSQVVLWG